jgi:hypothetical protein
MTRMLSRIARTRFYSLPPRSGGEGRRRLRSNVSRGGGRNEESPPTPDPSPPRAARAGGRGKERRIARTPRHCERHEVTRSNPGRGAALDCFVAIAPRNDEKQRRAARTLPLKCTTPPPRGRPRRVAAIAAPHRWFARRRIVRRTPTASRCARRRYGWRARRTPSRP